MYKMAAISPGAFAEEIEKILEEYGGEAVEALNESIEETAKESQKQIRKFNQGRTTWEEYPKGWTIEVTKERLETSATVYNKSKPGLTHLLEFGHALRNGGRSSAFPHIADVNDFAQKDVLERLERKLSK